MPRAKVAGAVVLFKLVQLGVCNRTYGYQVCGADGHLRECVVQGGAVEDD